MDGDTNDQNPATRVVGSARSKKRRNVVGQSPHREDYVRLMKAGWSSNSLERYAAMRYGEDIPARTFRLYRQRAKIEVTVDDLHAIEPDAAVDVLTEQARLIQMQKARIAIDARLEKNMNKLFNSTRGEIQALSDLLEKYKTTMQDLGLMPKGPERLEVSGGRDTGENERAIPQAQSLAEVFGASPEASADLAKVLHLHMQTRQQAG